MLAKAGIEHTAALPVMEAQFSSMTPQAAERYRAIVDAYIAMLREAQRHTGGQQF